MAKKLEGSCRCGAVHFTVMSHTLFPDQLYYCSVCRKALSVMMTGSTPSLPMTPRMRRERRILSCITPR
jgi:hypothetical protein